MKVAVFGTGKYYSIYKKWFINVEITAFLDNDKSKQANNRVVIFLIVFLFINRNRANQVVLFIGDIYFI